MWNALPQNLWLCRLYTVGTVTVRASGRYDESLVQGEDMTGITPF